MAKYVILAGQKQNIHYASFLMDAAHLIYSLKELALNIWKKNYIDHVWEEFVSSEICALYLQKSMLQPRHLPAYRSVFTGYCGANRYLRFIMWEEPFGVYRLIGVLWAHSRPHCPSDEMDWQSCQQPLPGLQFDLSSNWVKVAPSRDDQNIVD